MEEIFTSVGFTRVKNCHPHFLKNRSVGQPGLQVVRPPPALHPSAARAPPAALGNEIANQWLDLL